MFNHLLKNNKLAYLSFLITSAISLNTASNEPILVSNINNTGIERFGVELSDQYIVFNEFDQGGVLNRFSRNLNNPDPLITLRTGLSSIEDTFVFDFDDSLILSIDEANGGLSRSSFDGQSISLLSAPNNETPISFSGLLSDTDFEVFLTSDRNLYSIKNNDMGSAILLSSGYEVDRFRVTRDRQTVLFSAEIFPNNQIIFSIPIDGSSEATQIHVLPENSDVDGTMIVSIDSSRVIYIVETFLENSVESLQLYSTPIDGSSPPSALGDSVTGTASDIDFELSDDGTFVAFLLEESVFGSFGALDRLFTAPIDGSASITTIATFQNIINFDITNDSQTILYSEEDRNQDGFFVSRLFSAPFDDSAPHVSIVPSNNAEFSIGSRDFQASDNSEFVFYSAWNLSTFETKLFRSNADGSGNSIQVSANSPIVSNSEVQQFEVDSINSRIIYSTGNSGGFSNELFSVNFDGTGFSTLASANALIDEIDLSRSRNFVSYTTSSLPGDFQQSALYVLDISIPSEELCFPIKAQNGNFVTICF